MKDCHSVPAGNVAPNVSFEGNKKLSVALAKNAPANWLMKYGSVRKAVDAFNNLEE